jgi:hypothetical protein
MAKKDQPKEEVPEKPESVETPEAVEETPVTPGKKENRLKRLWRKYLAKKKITIPLTILLILGILFAVPWTRYKALGLFMTKNFSVTIVDAESNKPVSEAMVSLAGKTAATDGQGKAMLTVKPGNSYLTVTKKYYEDTASGVTVTLSDSKNNKEIKLRATGRQVPVTVTNKISGKGLKGAQITVLDTQAQTDDNGEAVLVLPADKNSEKVTLKLENFNDSTADIDISEQLTDKNKLTLTPAGKIYFLSKQSGKIDVVKTNLDGTDRQTVLAGTGKEDNNNTVMLASRDWKYLALYSSRDSEKAKIYLIETASDKLTAMDEGDADFQLIGWHNHNFVYKVTRNKKIWEPKREALKSFSGDNKALATMHESSAEGSESNYKYESFGSYYITNQGLVYATNWSASGWNSNLDGKQNEIILAKTGTSDRKVIKGIPIPANRSYSSLEARLYEPDEVYFAAQHGDKPQFYEYEDGAVKDAKDVTSQTFYDKIYSTFLLSPSGAMTFWGEPRDGKTTLFVGNTKGEEQQDIGALSELTPYGWFSDDYLLTSKKGSELYIMAKTKDAPQFKISDYHKPDYNGQGYGYGYGGF